MYRLGQNEKTRKDFQKTRPKPRQKPRQGASSCAAAQHAHIRTTTWEGDREKMIKGDNHFKVFRRGKEKGTCNDNERKTGMKVLRGRARKEAREEGVSGERSQVAKRPRKLSCFVGISPRAFLLFSPTPWLRGPSHDVALLIRDASQVTRPLRESGGRCMNGQIPCCRRR